MVSLLLALIYICFISLGLPDSLLGSAWPSMFVEFDVPISYAGLVSMVVCINTIISSLFSDKLTRKFGVGPIVFVSVLLTALAMLGFSLSTSFWILLILAIPYGLGAGSIDAALNNYVAIHYKSSHMSWLHCMWGLGAAISPYIMGYALTYNSSWNKGYLYVSIIQIVISFIVLISMPLWKNKQENIKQVDNEKPLTYKQMFKIPGVLTIIITFFCYCALEQTAMLWGSSYLVLHNGLSEDVAANLASLFFIGMTLGRAINGFLTYKFSDTTLIRFGQLIILIGVILMFLPINEVSTSISLFLIGLGCAPIYPCIVHSTPIRFGQNNSQIIIGVQMAAAYVGTCFMPPLFGVIAEYISASVLPIYLFVLLIGMILMHELVLKKSKNGKV